MAHSDSLALLVIAGSDSSAGAGMQRDLKVAADHQMEARIALTSITAQSDTRFFAQCPVPAFMIEQQIKAAATGCVSAVKIGMLANADAVGAVCEGLQELGNIPVVLDPVLASSSGTCLLTTEGVQRMRNELLAKVDLLTPNLPEAARSRVSKG